MPRPALTFARFVAGPENRSALLAVQDLATALAARRPGSISPLFLHGPAGTGKTHLVHALVEEATRARPDLVIALLAAGDLEPVSHSASVAEVDPAPDVASADPLEAARHSDLVVLEDLHHLSGRAVEPLVQLLDELHACPRPVVVTATVGPQQLGHRGERFPARLTSRLAAGLIVGLEPLQPERRVTLLADGAQRRQLAVGRDVLTWLAEHLSGGRALEGALTRLELLTRLHGRPPDVATVVAHFREQAEAAQVTVERIAQRVSGYFRLEPRQLQSRRRVRHVLWPRQVGMYLARQLTGLSLEQIGAFFGGRDHSTVLHACRKVEQALDRDPLVSGVVRQLHADLA
jgi:chromosomal replication initiator protein